ncbi:probable dolichyl pyrophosphate Man9GlcNAc2 alpha-1,3-glucosyltransferase [Musca vetustissima]|uniref:probable dolichyl pyrophosphate Man9GlcNAc2 alpha-1,3-glucosyltransferase n=1 Tax=Musca vetustissima TaxID=27455 RepID=UPI002AB77041|nr:probable dolichyl pyrophosphate Man9GlcNAc2 alpha-1,3-glucosyltransferase [Musca vetustissima]
MRVNSDIVEILLVICLGITLRGITSLSSYSGASTPPMFGDYEAQRHWQEITLNLPAEDWYRNTSDNDLLYWGLDYPPLTAYHSLVLGKIANRLNSSYVELYNSRGIESDGHKTFMRHTVLWADLFVYIPACIVLVKAMEKFLTTKKQRLSLLMVLMCYPGLILIDNGHFQYNNISLGLMLVAVAAVLRDAYVWAAFFFSLALNYKQMELYHALPFFVMLLRVAFNGRTFGYKIMTLFKIAMITLATFAMLWLPWLKSKELFLSVLGRLFPFNRGVFEDKVANIWCSLNVVYKFKENVTNSQMAIICLATTLLAILPLNAHAFYKGQKITFLFCLFNTAIAFFLFSFQVHEKSILLAALPAICLLPQMPFYVVAFLKVSLLSMLPLFIKDKLCTAYFSLMISFTIALRHFVQIDYHKDVKIQKILDILMIVLDIIILIISLTAIFVPSPARLPHIWSLFISIA